MQVCGGLIAAVMAASVAGGAAMGQSCEKNDPGHARLVRFGDESIGRWPGFAALRRKAGDGEQYFCGATAIAPQWLVTAAHCVLRWKTGASREGLVDADGWRLEAVLGTDNLDLISNSNIFVPDALIVHDEFAEVKRNGRFAGLANDIALLHLDRPWTGPLAPVASLGGSSTLLRVAGFGLTVGGPTRPTAHVRSSDGITYYAGSQRLKVATLPQVPLKRCRAAYDGSEQIGARQICAGSIWQGEDSCNGDSGGPLMTPEPDTGCPYLVGIVSWGPERCGAAGRYGIYTRIAEFADWIRAKSEVAVEVREPRSIPLTSQQRQVLSQLESALRPVAARAEVYIPDRGRLKSGRFFRITIDSPVSGHLVLVDVRPDGRIRQIVPNAFSAKGIEISSRSPVRIPDKKLHRFEAFEAEAAGGRGELVAIVVPESFSYDALAQGAASLAGGEKPKSTIASFEDKTGTAYLVSLVDQVVRAIAASQRGASDDGAKHWAFGRAEYRYVD